MSDATAATNRDFVGIVVAAGAATRFGGETPKQFLDLCGAPVLRRAVEGLAAHPGVRGVVVVLAPDVLAGPRGDEVRGYSGVLAVVPGGERRADSVRLGLAAAGDAPFVLVHDAARPLAALDLVDRVIEATRRHGACVPGLAVADTVKEVREVRDAGPGFQVTRTLDRGALRLAQTPQGARADWLRQALEAGGNMATDEAMALEQAGHPVAVVEGDLHNRKITTPDDLEAARRLLGESAGPDLRVGTGFDIHRVEAGRRLVLGGVEFPGETGLAGHSDADVVLHAAMDAVLGAAGLGDIGVLFPPDDERWRGADSRDLTRDVAARLAAAGARIVNLDLTVLAERPRIGPRREAMRAAIAGCFGVDIERVGLKATTLERLGALGRGEGIACEAVALIVLGPARGPGNR